MKRKPSIEIAKEKRQAWERRVNRQLKGLLSVGSRMSNVLFNLKQSPSIELSRRKLFAELQTRWDSNRMELPKWMRL